MGSDLEELLAELGVEDINPRDDEVYARCPMHEARTGHRENRPRHWSINRVTGAHFCFSCSYRGSLLNLVVDLTKQSPWEAQRIIRSHGLDFIAITALENKPKTEDDEDYDNSLDLTERLECFSDPPGVAIRQRALQSHSVVRYGVRWDREDHAWVLPIRGSQGDVWGYQTKSRDRVLNHPSGVRKSRTLFGLDLLLEQPPAYRDYVILVESPLDVVYLDGFGYPAVASFGSAVSDYQLRLLINFFDHFVLALDNDNAGRKETERILKTSWASRKPVEILNYDQVVGKDPGEMSEEEIETALETAKTPLWEC